MSLRQKLIAVVLGVALLPLALHGLASLRLQERGARARTEELHRIAAEAAAQSVDRHLQELTLAISRAAGSIRWAELTAEERTGALWLLYGQRDDVAVV